MTLLFLSVTNLSDNILHLEKSLGLHILHSSTTSFILRYKESFCKFLYVKRFSQDIGLLGKCNFLKTSLVKVFEKIDRLNQGLIS